MFAECTVQIVRGATGPNKELNEFVPVSEEEEYLKEDEQRSGDESLVNHGLVTRLDITPAV